MNTHREDADDDMAVDEDYAPMETSLTTDDDEDRQWQWQSRSVPITPPCSETDFPSSIQSKLLITVAAAATSHENIPIVGEGGGIPLTTTETEQDGGV